MSLASAHGPALGSYRSAVKWIGGTLAALVLWGILYSQLITFSEWAANLLPIDADRDFGRAIRFFLFDTPKVLLLLTLIVFAMGFVRSFFSPEKTRALLAGKREGIGNVLAATLGIVTPFCSCSAVPLFIGFVSAGVPLGVTFSFLISAPMVNEVALGLLFGLVGWKVAVTYLGFGLGGRDRCRLGDRPPAPRSLLLHERLWMQPRIRTLSSFKTKRHAGIRRHCKTD